MAESKRAQIFCIKLDGSESVPFIMKKDRLLLGRGDSCEIRVHVDGVASEHCAITVDQEGRAYLEPLDKCGLTFLNNSVIAEKILLEHNDMFKVVTRSFRFAYPETSAHFKSVTEMNTKKGNKESSRCETKSVVKSLRKNDNSSPSAPLLDMKITERKCMKQLLFRRQSLPNTAKLSLYKKCQLSLRSCQKSQASLSKRSSSIESGFQRNSVKKEKLEGSTTKKKVTFGPRLSPEEFDKNLPPASPLRRGSLPSASPFDQNLLKCKSDFESQKVHGIKKPCENYSISSPRRKLEFTSPVTPKPILKESESKKNCDLLRENKQHQKVPLFSEVLKKPVKNDNCAVKRIDKRLPFEKRRPKIKKMVLRSQVLCGKSPRQAFHQHVLGVRSTGHANSPDTIFICKKKTGTVNKELSVKKIQGENSNQHVASELTPNRNNKCKGKGKKLTENDKIPSPETCQLGQSSEMNHVAPEDLQETKNKAISVLKMKSPMKEITDNCVLKNKKSFEEININFAACGDVDHITEPKRNSRNDFNCDEEVPFTPIIMDANNLSTPKCLPKRKNSFRRKSRDEKTHTEKDLLAENCKPGIVTDSECNKLIDNKALKVVDEAVQSSVSDEEINKEKDLLSENFETVIVTDSECNKLSDNKALKVVDKAVQSSSVCDEDANKEKDLLSENCETVIISDSACNTLSDDKALKVVDKAVQSCLVCNEETNKKEDLLAENCKTVIVTDSECSKLSDDKAFEVVNKAVQSCSVCPKFGSNFLLNDSCMSTENLLRKLIFKVSMLNAFELYKQIIHNRDFFLKAIPHLCTPENKEEFDKRHPVNNIWKDFLEQVEGFENQKLLEGMLQLPCLQSPFHELFPSISGISQSGDNDGDKKSTSVVKYNQGHSQEQLLLNSMASSERMICSSAVKLQEPTTIDSVCASAMCSKISSVSGADSKTPEKSINVNEEKQQGCLQVNKRLLGSNQSPSNVVESATEQCTVMSGVLNECVDTRDVFKKSVRKENSIEELFNILISPNTQEKECSESEIQTECGQVDNLVDCKTFQQTDSQKADVSKTGRKFCRRKLSGSCDKHVETFKNLSTSEKDTKKKRNANRLQQSLLVKEPVSYRTRLQRNKENDKSSEMVNSMLFIKADEFAGSATSGIDLNEIEHLSKKRIRKNKNVSSNVAAKIVNKKKMGFKSEAHLTENKIKCVADVETNSFEAHESPAASEVDHSHIIPSQKKTRRRRVMTEASREQNKSEKKKVLKTKNMVDGLAASEVKNDQTVLPSQKKTRRHRVIAEASREQNGNENKNVLKNEENWLDDNIKCVGNTETINSCELCGSSKVSETHLNQIVLSSKKRKRKYATETSDIKTKRRKKSATKRGENLICANTEQSRVSKDVEVQKCLESSHADLKQTILPTKLRKRKVASKISTAEAKSKEKNTIKIEEHLNDVNLGHSGLTKDAAFFESAELHETDPKDSVFPSKKRKRKDASETSEAKPKRNVENFVCVNAGVAEDVQILENFEPSEAGLNQIALRKKGKRKDNSEVPKAKTKSKKKSVRTGENLSDIKHSEITKDTEVSESCIQGAKNVKMQSFSKRKNEKMHHFPSRSITTRSMVK